MKFWTIQSKKVLDIIEQNGEYQPDFKQSRYALDSKENMKFYQWLLENYNHVNGTQLPGLAYTFVKYINGKAEAFETYTEFVDFVRSKREFVWGLWHDFEKNSVVLELEVDNQLNPLLIDINDFQLLMPPELMFIPKKEFSALKEAFKNGQVYTTIKTCGLFQAHLPYIKKENIIGKHKMFEL